MSVSNAEANNLPTVFKHGEYKMCSSRRKAHHGLSGCLLFLFSLIVSPLVFAKTDLVFIVDGSGSISATDWNIQRQGIVSALQDPLVVPRDGEITVTVVQFASTARIEFPYRVIDSEADAQAAINAVQSMSQYSGSTGPGYGIALATNHLIGNGALEEDFQSYCMSTDGSPNSGPSVSSTISSAQSAAFTLDRFSVIAIEDPPFFYAADAQSNYGSQVFGGGAVFVVNNFTQFASFVGSLCLGEPLKLVGMEVTQVIQDLENKVALVEDKKTLVRTYLEPATGTDPVKASARLKGTRNGVELAGSPLTAVNSGGSIVAKPDALDRRKNLSDSLNFRLPDSWLNGEVTLELEGVGGTLDCKESAGPTANDCKTTVTFNSGSDFEVKLVKVKYENGGSTIVPSSADINELERRLLATYPTANIDRTTGTLDLGSVNHPQAGDVNSSLETMRFLDFCWNIFPFNCKRLYYGAVDQTGQLRYGTGFTGGLANDIPGSVSTGVIRDGNAYGRNRHGHEIGHTIGRHHATNAALVGTVVSGSTTYEKGPCNSVADSAAPNFPNIFNVNGAQRATIGPMNSGQDKLVFGWDSQRNSVVDPEQTFAMMSYCGPFRWPSDFTYEGIRNFVNGAASASSLSVASANDALFQPTQMLSATQSWILVRGIIDIDAESIVFKPVVSFELDTGITPPYPTGNDYVLIVKDQNGVELNRYPFTPPIMSGDSETGNEVSPETPIELGLVNIPVMADANTAEYVVEKLSNDAVLGSLVASDNAPEVTVVYPNGGEVLNPPDADFKWTGLDADGGPLTYTVQFSEDGGSTWETLVTDYTDTTLNVTLSDIAQTLNGLLRVQVSDGFHTAQDTSDSTFITPNTPPSCDIVNPLDNSSFVGVQPIVFDAFVSDAEGDVSNVQWSSNLDGNIGNGESIISELGSGSLPSGIRRLREGTHTITMTCSDSGGLTDSSSVTIEVSLIQRQIKGDADNDGDIDMNDINLLRQDLGNSIDGSSCGAKCDMNDDAVINALDMRLAAIACTRPGCAID
ncbi:hypothetical protein KUL118_67160 [Tenacibaculum sp. KUL118]|nr:hypothetical protein KUL118_67160 [Tenacibaculum sp. KUL118]